ncbi:DUF4340 domain-containing protein [Treponema pallidum]|nr:DUF4340 domain-containing protein [Treponema pallidum]WPQ97747.1 DUF4340 domain-containing protein [Treponema pallidum]
MRSVDSRSSVTRWVCLTSVILFCFCIAVMRYGGVKKRRYFYGFCLHPRERADITEVILRFPREERNASRELRWVKKDRQWFIQLAHAIHPAKQEVLERLFQYLFTKRRFEFITNNTRFFSDYALGKQPAVQMKFIKKNGAAIGDIYFGALNGTGLGRYIRIGDNAAVFLTEDDFTPFFRDEKRFWCDTRQFHELFTQSQIQMMEVSGKYIVRSRTSVVFKEVEQFFARFSYVDVGPTPTQWKESIVIHRGDGKIIRFRLQPAAHQEWTLWDAQSVHAYTLSAYTARYLFALISRMQTETGMSSLQQFDTEENLISD